MRGTPRCISDIILALVYVGIIGFLLDRLIALLGRHGHARHGERLRRT